VSQRETQIQMEKDSQSSEKLNIGQLTHSSIPMSPSAVHERTEEMEKTKDVKQVFHFKA